MIANYHTHNAMCHHAECTVEEYTKRAIEDGLQVIGHSDHFPFPFDALNDGRMKYNEVREYFRQIDESKELHKNEIKVLKGGEIEYIPDFNSYYERLLNKEGMDYLLLGQHFYSATGWDCTNVYCDYKVPNPPVMDYAKSCMDGMHTGYFAYLAHPDLIFLNDLKMTDDLKRAISYMVEESDKNNYVLELNAGGFRSTKMFSDGERHPYPVDVFWKEVAKTNIRVIVGSDAHHPNAILDGITDLEQYGKNLGVNLIQKLDI